MIPSLDQRAGAIRPHEESDHEKVQIGTSSAPDQYDECLRQKYRSQEKEICSVAEEIIIHP